MWFILIFLDFNFQRYILSPKHSAHKNKRNRFGAGAVAEKTYTKRKKHQQRQALPRHLTSHTARTALTLCTSCLDLENCNLQMRFISRARAERKRICKSKPLFSFWLGKNAKMVEQSQKANEHYFIVASFLKSYECALKSVKKQPFKADFWKRIWVEWQVGFD